jgi:PIN domain nuclease of toxin-antitoxin system
MNFLLDTHAFLWFSEDNRNLSAEAKLLIEDTRNNCVISIVSLWEIAIKISLKKLKIKLDFKDLLKEIYKYDFLLLPIEFEHTVELTSMKFYHRDPFDRLLVAQSKVENFSIISKDEIFDHYEIQRIW